MSDDVSDVRDRAADEIDVSEAMIAAGVAAFAFWNDAEEVNVVALKEAYIAMKKMAERELAF